MEASKKREEEVLREFPAVGKYRVRIVRKGERPPQLDIREYVTSDHFTGFTRRGVRFAGRAEWEQVLAILRDALQVVA